MYTKSQFGIELEQEMKKKLGIVHLSRWAFGKYIELDRIKYEEGLDEIVMKIVVMEEGPEFEYTEEGLEKLVADLKMTERAS